VSAVHGVEWARGSVRGIWRVELYRTGYLLLLSQFLSGLAGIVFWLLAARMYTPAVVGADSAAISAMQLISGIAQLNLSSALVRFVPGASSHARAMIGGAFALTAVCSAIAAGIFLFGLPWWAPGLSGVFGSPAMKAWLVVSTASWTILTLLTPALVSVSRVIAVPIVNGAFGAGRIVLAIGLAGVLPTVGVWVSWTAATVIATVLALGYLFLRVIPEFLRQAKPSLFLPTRRDIVRYVGPDFAGSVCWFVAVMVTPLLVFDIVGAQRAAVFALAWAITVTLYEVATAFGQSQLAAGSVTPDHLEVHFRQALKQTLGLLTVPVAVIVVAAPELLSIFGSYYAEHGSTVLRLLALSAFPNALLTLEVVRARVLRKLGPVAIGLALMCGVALALVVLLVPRVGIDGAGIAWLTALSAGAAVSALWHGMRRRGQRRAASVAAGAPADGLRPTHRNTDVAWATGSAGKRVVIDGRVRVVTETPVLLVHADGVPAVLKLSGTRRGMADIDHEAAVLLRLQDSAELGDWRALLPSVLSAGNDGQRAYVLTRRLGGTAVCTVSPGLTGAALAAIEPLHRRLAGPRPVDESMLFDWVGAPCDLVRAVLPGRRHREQLDRLADGLYEALDGRTLHVGWVHGDYSPGNVLACRDAPAILGIVDWAQASDHGLAVLDRANWLLTSDPGVARHLGRTVADRLAAGGWTTGEWAALVDLSGDLPGRTVLCLTWLRHVGNNLAKSDRYESSAYWIHRVIHPVLEVNPQ
jgi:O-antigen/teichoic acid export membrane protein